MVDEIDDKSKEENKSDIAINESLVESKDEEFNASTNLGENELGSVEVKVIKEMTGKIPGPGKVMGYGFKSLGTSLKRIFKHPLILIPAIILVIVWLVINILQSNGINNTAIKTISFLTFADAGTHGGFIGAVGGVIGKGLFAGAVVAIVNLFKHKNKGEKRSFKEKIAGSFGVKLDTLWAYLFGIGLAMFFFLFISGGATRISFMGGIATTFLAARAALNCGFLQMFIASFVSKGKEKASPGVGGCVRGIATGLLASSFIGLINVNLILIIIGSILVIGGIVMMILQATGAVKLRKEQAK